MLMRRETAWFSVLNHLKLKQIYIFMLISIWIHEILQKMQLCGVYSVNPTVLTFDSLCCRKAKLQWQSVKPDFGEVSGALKHIFGHFFTYAKVSLVGNATVSTPEGLMVNVNGCVQLVIIRVRYQNLETILLIARYESLKISKFIRPQLL